ncbi:hypothetical protein [Lacrimispora indolis]|uniref:hypothetical protein n=1 Tax=Lacrimispora indolis TaxID=69825 RepID=UPI000462B4BA|nr:hypothetical protein [[Clostridium] methoxybenzovorans]
MITKERYICEGCGQEFDDYNECERHEAECDNKHLKYRENVEETLNRAIKDFGSIISSYSYRTDEEVPGYRYCDIEIYKFEIDITLSNGNKFTLYDGCDEDLWLGNYLEADTIYKSLKREIESRLTLEYEGIIRSDWEDGWRTDKLGDVDLSDIVDRLEGRMVKIAIVEE